MKGTTVLLYLLHTASFSFAIATVEHSKHQDTNAVGFSIALTESIGDDGVVVVVAALLVAVVVHDVVAARFRLSVSSLDRSS